MSGRPGRAGPKFFFWKNYIFGLSVTCWSQWYVNFLKNSKKNFDKSHAVEELLSSFEVIIPRKKKWYYIFFFLYWKIYNFYAKMCKILIKSRCNGTKSRKLVLGDHFGMQNAIEQSELAKLQICTHLWRHVVHLGPNTPKCVKY